MDYLVIIINNTEHNELDVSRRWAVYDIFWMPPGSWHSEGEKREIPRKITNVIKSVVCAI